MRKMLLILLVLHVAQFCIMFIMMFTKCAKIEIPSLETLPGPRTGLPQLQVHQKMFHLVLMTILVVIYKALSM